MEQGCVGVLILVEGCDRTGKTTLCRDLAWPAAARRAVQTGEPQRRFPEAFITHYEKPTHHPLNEYGRPAVGHNPIADTLIMDRGFIGELVWPVIFGRNSDLDLPGRRWLEMLYISRGGRIIHATRDLYEIIAACDRDGEPVHGQQVDRACALFWERLRASECILPVHRYDQAREPLRAMEAWREIDEVCAQRLAVHHRWIGSPCPKLLLVGERVAPAARVITSSDPLDDRSWDMPFVPYKGTSGHFMLSDLPHYLIHDLAIVNALQPDGSVEDLPLLWETLGYPTVVTLGNVAAEIASKQGVPHGEAPHPQYVRRFKRAEGPGYLTNQILKAAS